MFMRQMCIDYFKRLRRVNNKLKTMDLLFVIIELYTALEHVLNN